MRIDKPMEHNKSPKIDHTIHSQPKSQNNSMRKSSLQLICLHQNIQMENSEPQHLPQSYTDILRYIIDLQEKAQTIKLLDEKLGGYLCDIKEGKVFLGTLKTITEDFFKS